MRFWSILSVAWYYMEMEMDRIKTSRLWQDLDVVTSSAFYRQ